MLNTSRNETLVPELKFSKNYTTEDFVWPLAYFINILKEQLFLKFRAYEKHLAMLLWVDGAFEPYIIHKELQVE